MPEWYENSHLSFGLDLLRWRRWRFDAGVDRANLCCELAWLFFDCGPIEIKLAIGH